MNCGSFPGNSQPQAGNISEGGGTSYRSYQQPTNLHPIHARFSSQHPSAHNQQVIAPLVSVHQNHQWTHAHDHGNPHTSTATIPPTSNVSKSPQSPPQPHQNPVSVNHIHYRDPDAQPEHHSMNPSQVASTDSDSVSVSVSATLAPVQALFQNVWTETQNQVARTHAYYDTLLGEERAKAAVQLLQAKAQAFAAKADADHYLKHYTAMQAQNDHLLAEIQRLNSEGTKLKRWWGKQKGELEKLNGELEKQNRTLMEVMQTQADDMQRLRDEWNVAQTVRVKLHAENQRLNKEVEEARDQLSKIENSFDEKVRAEFEIRLARVFVDERRRKTIHDNTQPPHEQPTIIVKTEDVIKIEDE